MEATLAQHQKATITLPVSTFNTLSSVAEAQHTTLNRLVENALIEMAEDLEDAALYNYMCENYPDGKVMVSEEEKNEFLKELGLS